MPAIATEEDSVPLNTEAVEGFAESSTVMEDAYGKGSSFDIMAAVMFFFVTLSLTIQFNVAETIKATKKHKPKLYFHYWSAVIILLVWYASSKPFVYSFDLVSPLTFTLAINVAYWHMFAVGSAFQSDSKHTILYSAPLANCIPTTCCKVIFKYFMTLFGHTIILLLICYIIHSVPTIILVYYLYPLHTLTRVPFIYGAIFYTIALGSHVLYMLEKNIELFKYYVLHVMLKCMRESSPCNNIFENKKIAAKLITETKEDNSYCLNYYLNKIYKNSIEHRQKGCTHVLIYFLIYFNCLAG